jgi:hypothetical protein
MRQRHDDAVTLGFNAQCDLAPTGLLFVYPSGIRGREGSTPLLSVTPSTPLQHLPSDLPNELSRVSLRRVATAPMSIPMPARHVLLDGVTLCFTITVGLAGKLGLCGDAVATSHHINLTGNNIPLV